MPSFITLLPIAVLFIWGAFNKREITSLKNTAHMLARISVFKISACLPAGGPSILADKETATARYFENEGSWNN